MKALVLDAWTPAAISVIQSLGRKGVDVHAASDLPCPGFRSRYVSVRLLHKGSMSPEHQVAWVREQEDREQYTLIVPSSEQSLWALQAVCDGDTVREKAILPSWSSVSTALNKIETRKLAEQLGVPVPKSRVLDVGSSAPTAGGYPVVLKTPVSQVVVDGIYRYAEPRVTCSEAVREHFLEEWLGSGHVEQVEEQAYVPGRGCGVSCLYERGKLRWHFTHERLHEFPLTGGASTYRRAAETPEGLLSAARSMLDALGWHGLAMVEFRVDGAGRGLFLEINPRPWGSLPLAVKAGVDFPAGLLALARGESVGSTPEYRVGSRMRSLSRDLDWMLANWNADHDNPTLLTAPRFRSVAEWLRAAVSSEGWDHFSLSDPGPGVEQLLSVGARLVQAGTLRVRDVARRRSMRALHKGNLRRFLRSNRQTGNVVFVCHGNICRSPLAEALARRSFAGWRVSSTGLHATPGRRTPARILRAASEIGVDLSGHRARILTREDVDAADLLVAMASPNLSDLVDRFPRAKNKVLLLGLFDDPASLEIPDPIALDEDGALASAERLRRALGLFESQVVGSKA